MASDAEDVDKVGLKLERRGNHTLVAGKSKCGDWWKGRMRVPSSVTRRELCNGKNPARKKRAFAFALSKRSVPRFL